MACKVARNGNEINHVAGKKRTAQVLDGCIDRESDVTTRQKYVSRATELNYPDAPLKIVKGEGQYLIDENGDAYLDCINNVAHVGHCHPHVVDAGCQQMKALCTNSRFLHDEIVTLAQRLLATMPKHLTKCIFVCTGTEANDLAMQMARAYTKRNDVMTLDRAYHGHSVAVMEISPYKYKNFGGKKPTDNVHITECPDPYNGKYQGSVDDEKLADKYVEDVQKVMDDAAINNHEIAAFYAESIQSCGGQIFYPKTYLKKAFESVRKRGGVCIADEVQVGFGRVGDAFWAFQLQDAMPDIVTLGKPMGNGHPVSAVITTDAIAEAFANRGTTYFNTFGGNPVSCAVANAVLDVIENEDLQNKAVILGKYWVEEFKKLQTKHTVIGDVRGIGLFIGIELVKDRQTKEPASEVAYKVIYGMKSRKILVSRDGMHNNILKFKPPMIFSKENVDCVVKNLDEVLSKI